ncbi:MAG: nucleoside/nucleotide kinase family protein [Marmoricola sp.]|nr:nucleoside/nucleotide kinase family protein [Marmoricola sp.]
MLPDRRRCRRAGRALIPVSGPDVYDGLVDRAVALTHGRSRTLIGITGTPGAGKSTIAEVLVAGARARGIPAVWVPMDGYHLADVSLRALGSLGRKGALDTFDGHGYVSLLRRLREEADAVVYAPAFERDIEQPVAGSIAVNPQTQLVVTEGNYLLCDIAPWHLVRGLLDEIWYVDVDPDERRRRLLERHVSFGKSPAAALAWVQQVDEANAAAVAVARLHATAVVSHGAAGEISIVEQSGRASL